MMCRGKAACLILLLIICLLTACGQIPTGMTGNSAASPNGLTLPDDPRYPCTYPAAEFLNDESYRQYMDDDGTQFRNLLRFYDALCGSTAFTFASFAENPVELVNTAIPERCAEAYGTAYAQDSYYDIAGEPAVAALSLQVSESFLELFPLEIAEGRGFERVDYDTAAQMTIPVILGADYQGIFRVGDRFEGYYIFERFTFEVVGIAKSGGVFYNKRTGGPALYDSYLILPFQGIRTDSPFGRIVLLQKICGFVVAENGRDAAGKQIHEYLIDAGLSDWQDQWMMNEKAIG